MNTIFQLIFEFQYINGKVRIISPSTHQKRLDSPFSLRN
jgi:hypothetical protein